MKNTLLFFSLLLLISCATMDMPTGGDKDVTAPKIVASNPDSAGINFTGKKISIEFDEYFSLNNLSKQLIISPTLNTPPSINIKGKNLLLTLEEDLKPNTTYQIYFGDGIKDVNEGNKTDNLRLVFSTGPEIDSGYLGGSVVDAFKRSPIKDCKVLLYENQQDSQLIKDNPLYITKTDKNGIFSFYNINPKAYFMYALLDENNNNKLDLKESFAVLSEPTVIQTNDNNLLLSPHTTNELTITDWKEASKSRFKVVFNKDITGKPFVVSSPQSSFKNNELAWHYGQTNDTVYFYTGIDLKDSFTVDITVGTKSFTKKLKHTLERDINKSISVASFISPEESIVIHSNYGIKKTNSTKLQIFDQTDSIQIEVAGSVIEKIGANSFDIKASLKEGHMYHLYLDQAFVNYMDDTYSSFDTLKFTTQSKNETGEIEVHYQFDSSYQKKKSTYYAVLLLNEKIISKTPIEKDTVITYNYLKPENYSVYVFEDLDNNTIWSAANYFENLKSEQIWWLNSALEVRAKWKNKNIILKVN